MVRETTLSSSVSATAISLGETASTNSVSRLSRKPPALLCTTTCQEHPTAWISLLRSLGERFRSRTGEDLSQLIRSNKPLPAIEKLWSVTGEGLSAFYWCLKTTICARYR